MSSRVLSKSDYLLYLKHPAWLWLKRYAKDKLPPVTENDQAVFDAGYLFESYAEKLFSGGVRIGHHNYHDYQSMPARTQAAFSGGAGTVFQGRFEAGRLTCICDVICRTGEDTVDLYEIKSSTRVKSIQEHDLAFQAAVLMDCGYRLGQVKILHVNRDYVRQGEIDSHRLVQVQDVTAKVAAGRADTRKHIAAALAVLDSSVPPDFSPVLAGSDGFRDWLAIYRTLNPPATGSIYELCYLNPDLLQELLQRQITYIKDIPDDLPLNRFQQRQILAARENRPLVDYDPIRRFLNQLSFPLYFLDYETLSSIVPLYDGQRPYQQVPFQYSLHRLDYPDAPVIHQGYLHRDSSNPVVPLTAALQSAIGPAGSVLVWDQRFEKSRNVEMGCTTAACSAFYADLNSRIVDLMEPFAQGWYVDPGFLGRTSIKKVLPVLVPSLSYQDLDIREGATAQRLWMETVLDKKHQADREDILSGLEAYCRLDTLAMVEIYRFLAAVC